MASKRAVVPRGRSGASLAKEAAVGRTRKKATGAPTGATAPRIIVEGFKCLRDRWDVELRPLTLLAGQNSSGKSSLMQPLLLIKQTQEAPYDPGPLLLDGECVRFTSAEQLFWLRRRKTGSGPEFRVGTVQDGSPCELVFRHTEPGLTLVRLEFSDANGRHALKEDMRESELRTFIELKEYLRSISKFLKCLVRRNRSFLVASLVPREIPRKAKAAITELALDVLKPGDQLATLATNLIHLPGSRGNPQRWYPRGQAGTMFPGVFSPYSANVVAAWKQAGDARLDALGAMLQAMNLTWKVDATELDDTRVELRVGRLPKSARGGARDLVNIADVGFGVSQVLPVLVALLAAKPGQIVYIEQPELHLHPQAQVAMAECLLDTAARGVIVVAETHSPLLLTGVREAIAAGRQPAELVKLHWFARGKSGATTITSAGLDQRGAFGPWPEDFSTVEMDIEDRYLSAVTVV